MSQGDKLYADLTKLAIKYDVCIEINHILNLAKLDDKYRKRIKAKLIVPTAFSSKRLNRTQVNEWMNF